MTDATRNYHSTNEDGRGLNPGRVLYIGVAECGAISFWPSLSSPEPFADHDRSFDIQQRYRLGTGDIAS